MQYTPPTKGKMNEPLKLSIKGSMFIPHVDDSTREDDFEHAALA